MATKSKKIRLDFSKVEERTGWNSRQMPEGLYEAVVSVVDDKEAGDGTAMLTYGLKPTSKKYATRNFPYYCKLQQNQLWKLRDLFVGVGETVPKKAVNLDPSLPVGQKLVIEIVDGTGQYSDRSEVLSVYPMSALEDLTGDEDDDEEEYDEEESDEADDEEYEDDDSDEDDDEYEDDDEDLDEDEDDEDDEDLDDEDLDDEEEDEDDEEEEPEPAPKRARKPVAKKPAAKKAPAKAAPKRVVKRRR